MVRRGLNKTSDVPLYAQLAARLRHTIESRELSSGELLPSEASIGAQFAVSRITVRQAMARLVAEGLIRRAQGRGTYIRARPIVHHFARSFEEELLAEKVPLKLVVRGWRRKEAPAKVSAALQLKTGEEVFELERVKFVDEEPIGWELRYVPTAVGLQVSTRDLAKLPIYQLLKRATDAQVARIVSTVQSIGAPLGLAKILHGRAGEPLLMREQTYFDGDDQPLMHGMIAFRGDQYRFIFECGPGQLRMDATTAFDRASLMPRKAAQVGGQEPSTGGKLCDTP